MEGVLLPKGAMFLIIQVLVYLILLDSTDIFSTKATLLALRSISMRRVLAYLFDFPAADGVKLTVTEREESDQ